VTKRNKERLQQTVCATNPLGDQSAVGTKTGSVNGERLGTSARAKRICDLRQLCQLHRHGLASRVRKQRRTRSQLGRNGKHSGLLAAISSLVSCSAYLLLWMPSGLLGITSPSSSRRVCPLDRRPARKLMAALEFKAISRPLPANEFISEPQFDIPRNPAACQFSPDVTQLMCNCA
jgi:hypothetical protein